MDLQNIVVTNITDAATVYSKKGEPFNMKKRKAYGLSLCIDGKITYVQNGVEYVSDKDVAVFLPKGQSYSLRRDKTGHFPLINFDCLGCLCDTVTVIPIPNRDELLADYERIKRLSYIDNSRNEILSIFYGMLHRISANSIPTELDAAVKYIYGNYSSPQLSNSILASQSFISEVYFRRLFTAHFGISPKKFILNLRIAKAKQLLSEGFGSVSSISEKCGFSSQYHFCRIFKARCGITPSEYRRLHRIYDI
ncbi:MAG: helix-turn-helix domain-containing protein [Ruminococcaceae bacterium]|nr:helix-turn-helix domain-containing protein [Oscillospiraceae bacterium]